VLGERDDEKNAMPVEEIRRMSENIEWNRKTLRDAFHDNPYERFKTKVKPRFPFPTQKVELCHLIPIKSKKKHFV
jgi:hypothetical protein